VHKKINLPMPNQKEKPYAQLPVERKKRHTQQLGCAAWQKTAFNQNQSRMQTTATAITRQQQ